MVKGVKSTYDGDRAGVKWAGEGNEYSEVKSGLRKECVMSLEFFNAFYDRVFRLVNEKATGNGVILSHENGKGWEIKQLKCR